MSLESLQVLKAWTQKGDANIRQDFSVSFCRWWEKLSLHHCCGLVQLFNQANPIFSDTLLTKQ